MNPVIMWLQKEFFLFTEDLPRFANYYTMRDRLPLYVTILYLIGRKRNNILINYVSASFLIFAGEIGALSLYNMIKGIPDDTLTGFHWNHIAPIQYVIQIFTIFYIAWKSSKNITYSVALGYNGAAATGYVYESPLWFYSVNYDRAHLLHSSYRYVFFVDYQIIAIGVFLWLLRKQNVKFKFNDLILFISLYGTTFLMASKIYTWQTKNIIRIPIIIYFIYLTCKLGNITLIKLYRVPYNALHRIVKIPYYFKSRRTNSKLTKGDIACVMCVWDEQKMVPYALESSKNFVSRYVIVDKNGGTLPIIEKCAEQWNLNIETYIKPNMSLREARLFAIEKINEPWILIQDGDEVFHTDGENNISNLRYYMNRPNIILCTKMAVLMGDFHHTRKDNPVQPPHKFLYHNNGTIHSGRSLCDIPDSKAWIKILPGIWKFNCIIKHPRRHYLREFWDQWCLKSEYYKIYPNIEDYVTKELGINIDEEYMDWYKKKQDSFLLYNEKQLGYYPEIIRRELY